MATDFYRNEKRIDHVIKSLENLSTDADRLQAIWALLGLAHHLVQYTKDVEEEEYESAHHLVDLARSILVQTANRFYYFGPDKVQKSGFAERYLMEEKRKLRDILIADGIDPKTAKRS